MNQDVAESNFISDSDIAIIAMSCRVPGANNPDEFWQNLRDGVESVSWFEDEELSAEGIDTKLLKNPNYVKAGAVLEDIDKFDAFFFDINGREAAITDPQHRIFLECASEAIEKAGYNPHNDNNNAIALYAGVGMNSYFFNNVIPHLQNSESASGYQAFIGNDKDFVPTRVSYKLNLKGASLNVNTACSSSLVAVHLACQSLLSGECDMAMAGGVSINPSQKNGYMYQEGMIMSPDGHCRSFDAKAKGTVGGSGAGVVVLKRLADAIADGDNIEAVIKGSAINNDGAMKIGYTAPSIDGQAAAISEAIAIADIEPDTISYIEAHGTATELGDPIEIAALTKAFRAGTDEKQFCAIGSVKSNFGHLDTAAGVAGLIKAVLALKHKQIPPSLHFEQPNPKIDFANSPFFVNNKLTDWNPGDMPRRAGVSAFGIGGTNAHVVLEEYGEPGSRGAREQRSRGAGELGSRGAGEQGRRYNLLLLSAKTATALDMATANLATYLEQNPKLNLADVAYTLQVGRRTFDRRRMVVCDSVASGAELLKTLAPQQVFSQRQEAQEHPVAFMFSGQGSQYVNMGRELYENEPVFRETCDRCFEILAAYLDIPLKDIIFSPAPLHLRTSAPSAPHALRETQYAQPAIFIIEYALAQLWISWGIKPQSAIGHSIGEYVAATLAGVFALEDALTLVAHRGRLMQHLPPGAMVAVSLSAEEVKPLLGDNLWIATINTPKLTVVSGTIEAIAAFEQKLETFNQSLISPNIGGSKVESPSMLGDLGGITQKIDFRHLHTSHGFHSPMMEPILEAFTHLVAKVELNPPQIPYLSNVTGTWITNTEATDPMYWAKHIRQPVLFSEGLQKLLTESAPILLEVGAGRTLCTLAKRHLDKSASQTIINSLPHPHDDTPSDRFILNTLGQLWLAGAKIDWRSFHGEETRYRIPLPTYPFERKRYWLDTPKQQDSPVTIKPQSLSKKTDIADWFYLPTWKSSIVSPHKSQQLTKQHCWLVFMDEWGVGSELLTKLEQENQKIILLKVGTGFSKLDNRTFTINPTQPQDYQTLFETLQSLDRIPDKILHLWSITNPKENQTRLQQVEQVLELGFDSLFYLAQTLGKENLDKQIDLTVFSHSVQSVTGEEIINPEQATVLGTVKVIEQENPQINCQSIDVVLPQTEKLSKIINQLWSELISENRETIVAYRGNQRWVQTYETIKVEAAKLSRLKQGGVYLITGGLGGTGLVLANHLAKAVQAKLVLIGRSSFPAQNEWMQWLATHPANDATSLKIKKLQTIEELGSEVLTFSADVTNLQQMQTVVDSVKQTWGAIHGVIHTAGLPGTTVIQRKTLTEARQVLAPKVQGTIVLESIFADEDLDFMVLFSSINAVVGGFGQVDYCAANSFLDAFAHSYADNPNRFVTSINWDAWQQVGMAVNTEVSKSIKTDQAEMLKQGIFPSEGVEVFDRILNSVLSQVLVSTMDFASRLAPQSDIDETDLTDGEEVSAESYHSRPDLSSIYVAPSSEVENAIAKIWQKHIGVDKVGIHDNFFDLGGDSLIGLQVVEKLNREFDTKLPATTIYKAPTVSTIAQLIQPPTTEVKATDARRSRGERRREKKLRQRKE